MQENIVENPFSNFTYALQSEATRRQYPRRLKVFFDFCFKNNEDIESQAFQFIKKVGDSSWMYSQVMKFISVQKVRITKGEITSGTLRNYIKSVKLFCEMNDIVINWKKISKGLPKEKQFGDDRIPRIDEIHKLLQYPDRRIKPIICLLISSGIRAGAFDFLKWKHIIPIEIKSQTAAAKIVVYGGEPDEYYSFITPEAYHELKDWMDFRASYGEKITGESWLMRDTWQKIDTRFGNNIGMITYPKQLKSTGVKSLMDRAIRTQKLDIMIKGVNHKNKREWKALHGFRKYFNTTLANAHVDQLTKEILMGHDIGLDKSYHRPTEAKLLQEYLKAVNDLTISEEFRLKQQVAELSEKTKDSEYIIKAKLAEKDQQVQVLKKLDKSKEKSLAALSDKVVKLMKEVQQLKKEKH